MAGQTTDLERAAAAEDGVLVERVEREAANAFGVLSVEAREALHAVAARLARYRAALALIASGRGTYASHIKHQPKRRPMTADTIHTCSYSCERPECIRAQRDELVSRLEALTAAQRQPAEGEEIMVNTPYDVFTLPLQPSGLSSGPRFVVHVPGPEQPTADKPPANAARAALAVVRPVTVDGWQFCVLTDNGDQYVAARPLDPDHALGREWRPTDNLRTAHWRPSHLRTIAELLDPIQRAVDAANAAYRRATEAA